MTCTEGCKNIKNRNPNLASARPSARGRDFTQPIAYIFTHLSTYTLYKYTTTTILIILVTYNRLKAAVGILLQESAQLRVDAAEGREAVRALVTEIGRINTTVENLLRDNPRLELGGVSARETVAEREQSYGVLASSVSQVGTRALLTGKCRRIKTGH